MSDINSNISRRSLLKVGLFANIFEFYEFSVYGYLSDILGQLFFKSATSILALAQAFFLFAISYLVRPLGGLFFSYYSDRYGRGASLKISLLLMSAPTILIGCLPSYQTIGYWATGLLLLLRLAQGVAAGGEFPVSACYVFEGALKKDRSLLCGIVSNSTVVGMLCGSAVISLLFWVFDRETIRLWAWRIPFLLGIPLTAWIAYIRKGIIEPKISSQSPESRKKPLITLLTSEKQALLKAFVLIAFCSGIGVYVLSIWMPFYLIYFVTAQVR